MERQVREGEDHTATAAGGAPTPPTPMDNSANTESAQPNPIMMPKPVQEETVEESEKRSADYWNAKLEEDDFHDIINDEDQMYDDIEALPAEDDNMVNQILSIVKNHVSEIWSPPRVNALASQYGLQPGFSYDIQVDDESGRPWDFDVPEQRAKCIPKHP